MGPVSLGQERDGSLPSRVQTYTERGPLVQRFRLANVTVTTASVAGGIHGLDRVTVEGVVAGRTEFTRYGQREAA